MSFQPVLNARNAEILSKAGPSTNNAHPTIPDSSSGHNPAGSAEGEPPEVSQQYLDVPTTSSYRPRPSIDSTYSELSELSIYSDELQRSRPLIAHGTSRLPSASPAPARRGWRGTLNALWIRNKGVVLVLLAQAFGSLMNVSTRILETDGVHGKAMDPFQVHIPPFHISRI